MADAGFAESARCLSRESDASLAKSDAAPDAHLRGVLREWQDARERATGVRPRLTSHESETGKKGVAARWFGNTKTRLPQSRRTMAGIARVWQLVGCQSDHAHYSYTVA